MQDIVPVRRALLSVSDKSGLIAFAEFLASNKVELVSTGGTAGAIRNAGIPVRDVSELTDFPEMFGGRVKTLHPMVHGGLLFERDNPEHVRTARENRIEPIDLLVVNLYPFEQTILKAGVSETEANENIDIGGPAMIRGAAKNSDHVAVLVDPQQYAAVGAEIAERGGTSAKLRRMLKTAAYQRTAAYDAAVAAYLQRTFDQAPPWNLKY